jgi:hypothetical protein
MAFVRVKTIKGNRYAYLVENTWQTRGSRQTVKGYLGKVVKPDAQPFGNPPDISSLSYADAITTLASWTLANHGFSQTNDVHTKDAISVHLSNKQVLHKTKSAVLELNEGFLCGHTLSQLLDFVGEGSREEEVGQRLANTLLEAGIAVPQDTFVTLFHKIFKPLPEAPR